MKPEFDPFDTSLDMTWSCLSLFVSLFYYPNYAESRRSPGASTGDVKMGMGNITRQGRPFVPTKTPGAASWKASFSSDPEGVIDTSLP